MYPLPTFASPTPLAKTKGALAFGTFTGTVYGESDAKSRPSLDGELNKAKDVPVIVTHLAVGCKRKIVLYSWRDGEPQEVKVSLTHLRSLACSMCSQGNNVDPLSPCDILSGARHDILQILII